MKNAFNSARWSCILEAMLRLQVPAYIRRIVANYLSHKTLLYNTDRGAERYEVTGGVPQGSVLGDLLWNIMYDGVLHLDVPTEAKIVGFADEIAIAVFAKHVEQVIQIAQETIGMVRQWLSSRGLQLAENTTEAVLITGRKQRETITFTVGDFAVTSKPSIRYLGITIHDRLSFKQHLDYVGRKAVGTTAALACIMPNIEHPKHHTRLLLAKVAQSVILYGAPGVVQGPGGESLQEASQVRSQAECTSCHLFLRNSSRRRSLCSGRDATNRHLGRQASQNTREQEPRKERRKTEHLKNGNTGGTGPIKLDSQINQVHKGVGGPEAWRLDYYLTQLLTGHSCFRAYLYCFAIDFFPECPACRLSDTAEHVFFTCDRFEEERRKFNRDIGEIFTLDNLIAATFASLENWNAAGLYAAAIISRLRDLKRERTNT